MNKKFALLILSGFLLILVTIILVIIYQKQLEVATQTHPVISNNIQPSKTTSHLNNNSNNQNQKTEESAVHNVDLENTNVDFDSDSLENTDENLDDLNSLDENDNDIDALDKDLF